MNFEIYFDESNKLDKADGRYAYYGIIGWKKSKRLLFDNFMKENNIFQELHFSEFKLDKINNYIKALKYVLPKIDSNFYIVNKKEAIRVADTLNIDEQKLRKLFYLKIPERLIYGMIRKINEYTSINVFIDKSEEYGDDTNKISKDTDLNSHIQLPYTLKTQLNAQAIYRNLNYSVGEINQLDSEKSKSLQITDVLLGIIRFLYEEEYLNFNPEITMDNYRAVIEHKLITEKERPVFIACYKHKKQSFYLKENVTELEMNILREVNKKINMYSIKNIERVEFIYNLLQDEELFECLSNMNLFLWEDENLNVSETYIKDFKEVSKHNLSKYISKFLRFKTEYDNKKRLELLLFNNNEKRKDALVEKDYTNFLMFPGRLKLMVRRYLKELKLS